MKKITKKILLIACLCFATLGCNQKQEKEIIHNDECAKNLEGKWQLSTMSQAKFSPDPEDPDFVLGVLTYKTNTTLSFLPGRQFNTIINQEGLSFSFTKDEYKDYGYTEEELITSVNQNIVISGQFTSSEELLQLENNDVSINGGEKVSFEEAIISNPSLGNKQQICSYQIKDNKLNFNQNLNGKELSVVYSKTEF